jgi:rod shape-determining protein MreD
LRSVLVFSLALVACGVLQSSLVAPGGRGPDLLLLTALVAGWMRGTEAGAAVGLGAGLLMGTLQGGALGGCAISRLAAGYAVGRLREEMYGERPGMMALACFAGTGLAAGVLVLWSPPRGAVEWMVLPLQAALNAALSVPLHYLLKAASGWRGDADRPVP